MPFKIQVVDRKDRKAQIDAEVKSSSRTERFTYRNRTETLPVIQLPLELPIYRMKNFRTSVEQLDYIRQAGKKANFFANGEETVSAQTAQHKILLQMSKDDRGDIYGELEHVAAQSEALLLTSHGVVVNGNRRLAAMRELYSQGSGLYKSFAYIDALILPESAGPKEIDLIESELQMRPETKLEYDWIPRRLKLRYELSDLKIDRALIKEVYRFKRESDINKELHQLDLVDEYLEFIGARGQYKLAEQSEQIFKELQASIDKSPEEAQRSRQVAFLLIKHAQELKTRVYDYRNAFGKDLNRVLEQFALENNVKLPEASPSDETDAAAIEDSDDPLAGMDKKPSRRYEPLSPLLRNTSKSKNVAEHIARIYDSIKEEKKEEDKKRAGLKAAQDANRLLHSINLTEADPDTFSSIMAQLEVITSRAEKIKAEIQRMVKAKKRK